MKRSPILKLGAMVGTGIVALMLIGCNGSNGPAGTNGTNGTNGTSGTNGLPPPVNAANYTPAQWAALKLTTTITSVTMTGSDQGTAVVNFSVADPNGNPITGLAVPANGSNFATQPSPATVGTYPNFAFSIAKLIGETPAPSFAPSRWVNYLTVKAPVAPATTPTAGFPDPEQGSASNPVKDNGDGTYTYTFMADLANAQTLANTAETGNAQGLADLDNLTYTTSTTHRLIVSVGGYQPTSPSSVISAGNAYYDFIPATGLAATASDPARNIVAKASCDACHTNISEHGTRFPAIQDPNLCVVCHTDQLVLGSGESAPTSGTTLVANGLDGSTQRLYGDAIVQLPNFIHKIHFGPNLGLSGYNIFGLQFQNIWYPQDIRNCTTCHTNGGVPSGNTNLTAQGDNWYTKPGQLACGSCHDTLNIASVSTTHKGGPQVSDATCAGCHTPTFVDIPTSHIALANPTQAANGHPTYTTKNWQMMSTTNMLPGTVAVTYNIVNVTVVNGHPQITFQILLNGTAATINPYLPGTTPVTTEMLAPTATGVTLANGPMVGLMMGLPQDGITSPMDSNLFEMDWPMKSIWNGTAFTTGYTAAPTGTLGTNYALIASDGIIEFGTNTYQITLDGISVPATVQLLGMIIGENGFVQTNLTTLTTQEADALPTQLGFSTTPQTPFTWTPPTTVYPAGSGTGGILVPGQTASMWASTATGTPALTLTARRSIIKPDSCNSCHGNLGGFTPTPTGQTAVNGYAQNFHNQYNNDPTSCVLCHTPNGVSYGFSYNAKEWMHGIHSNGFRAVPYTVHDTSQYWRINYPAILNNCEACHVPGSYDFSNGVNAGQIPSMLWDTVAANIAASGLPVSVAVVPPAAAGGLEALVPPATGNFASPWITIPPGGTVAAQAALETEFGAAYTATPLPALPATVWTPTPAGPATLVTSPLTAACSACHNDQTALTHMVVVGGGVYYQARMSVPLAPVGGNPGAVNSPTAPVLQSNEQCLICHGPGTAGDIRAAHINF